MPWGTDSEDVTHFDVDLGEPSTPAELFRHVNEIGTPTALILAHCESVDSDIRSTTVESFDRHMAVNARATWLLIQGLAEHFAGEPGAGRIVSITSDHTAGNLPYGASKGAMDRIVLAAAVELADLGITANVVNPGATDTGWITDDVREDVLARNLQSRVGTTSDCANLVRFLCSGDGQWINGQLIHSDGGRLT